MLFETIPKRSLENPTACPHTALSALFAQPLHSLPLFRQAGLVSSLQGNRHRQRAVVGAIIHAHHPQVGFSGYSP